MTTAELDAARDAATKIIGASGGKIKQQYLAARQNADLGIASVNSKTITIAPGITVRVVQNGPHQTMTIVVRASEVIGLRDDRAPPMKRSRGDFVIISHEALDITANEQAFFNTRITSPVLGSGMRDSIGYINDDSEPGSPGPHDEFIGQLGPNGRGQTHEPYYQYVKAPKAQREPRAGKASEMVQRMDTVTGGSRDGLLTTIVFLQPFKNANAPLVTVEVWGFSTGSPDMTNSMGDVRADLFLGKPDPDAPRYTDFSTFGALISTDTATAPRLRGVSNGYFYGDAPIGDVYPPDNLPGPSHLADVVVNLLAGTVSVTARGGEAKPLQYFGSYYPVRGYD